MNRNDFIQEVKKSSLCPDDFDIIYADFCKYQKLANDTLLEFHKVCERNCVPYQLAYGSLLGAVRDQGQIPWDYDIDVWVPYSYKSQLIRALQVDLDSKYYFYCPEVNDNCRHFLMRLAPKGYRSEALHVDVFYTIEVPSDIQYRNVFVNNIHELFIKRFHKLVKCFEEYNRLKPIIKCCIYKTALLFVSASEIRRKFDELCQKSTSFKSNISVSIDEDITKHSFNTNKMWQTKLIKLDTGEFRISKDYINILTEIYGEYMSIPSLNNRLSEMMASYRKIKRFEKRNV